MHRRAGDHAEIDDKYRGLALCRRCGMFRRTHGVDPSTAILRCWSKNIKPTAVQITDAIKAGKTRKRRKAS